MYQIPDESECWCASKIRYKDCCGKIHKEFEDMGKKSLHDLYSTNRDFSKLLKLEIAEFVQYLIYIKSHTEPLILTSPPDAVKLIDIDINALTELLNKILYYIKMSNSDYDFLSLISRSKDLFFCSKWHKKVEYFTVVWLGIYKNDLLRAFQFIEEHINISTVNDNELLEVLLDIYSEKLSMTERFDICRKIQKLNTDPLKVSHYIAIEGIFYLELGEEKKGIELFEKCISIIENSKRDKDVYNNENIGRAYSMLGALKNDESLISKAIAEFSSLLNGGKLNSLGVSNIYWEIGNAFAAINKYEDAIINYDKAYSSSNFPIALIDKARIYIICGEYSKAKSVLNNEINYIELSNDNKIDYLFTYAKILCFEYDDNIDFIINEIKKYDFRIGIFRDKAQKILLTLSEIKLSKNAIVTAEKKKNWIDNLNECFLLQPNIFGLGININKIIELIRRKNK